MQESTAESAESSIDYDAPPVAELELGEIQYRVDPGFRGAIAVSQRATGTWSWSLVAEGKWDGIRLKAKPLDRSVTQALEKALRESAQQSD
jgi:hypothetical protein